jgi:hypothetical protein
VPHEHESMRDAVHARPPAWCRHRVSTRDLNGTRRGHSGFVSSVSCCDAYEVGSPGLQASMRALSAVSRPHVARDPKPAPPRYPSGRARATAKAGQQSRALLRMAGSLKDQIGDFLRLRDQ